MIKAIITDIDGVIVGKTHGINFPLPNEQVIEKLKNLHKTGLPIVLCTAKSQAGIQDLVKQAELTNPHITDGGALISDSLNKRVIKQHILSQDIVDDIVTKSLEHDIYVEGFNDVAYFMQENQIGDITEKHTAILQQEPTIVSDLPKQLATIDVIKILIFYKQEQKKTLMESVLQAKQDQIHVVWTHHPTLLPIEVCVITKSGVSKKHASLEVLNYLNISPEETLAIGDTLGDWHFMEMCGYVGVVGDSSEELKNLAKEKGEGKYFLGGSVDDDGFLQILDYFKL